MTVWIKLVQEMLHKAEVESDGQWRNIEGMIMVGERANSPERGVCSVGRRLAATKSQRRFLQCFRFLSSVSLVLYLGSPFSAFKWRMLK